MVHLDSPPGYNRRLVGWLSLAQLISWGSVFYLFGLIMAPVESALQVTRAQSSLAFSLALLADGLLAFPVGRLIDRGHERAVMTIGSLLLALGLALHAFVTSLAQLYAVWVLLGAGMSMSLYSPVFAVVTRRFPGDFRRAIITMTFLGGLASTVFIPLTAWLIVNLGWRQAVLVLATINLLVCAPLHFFSLRNAPKVIAINTGSAREKGRFDEAGQTLEAAQGEAGSREDMPTRQAPSLVSHLTSPTYWLIGLAIVFMTVASAALPTHIITLLREYGLSEAWVVAIPASIGLLQVVGRLLLYFFEHRFDLHVANRLIPALMPVAVTLLLAAPWLSAPGSHAMLLILLAFVALWGMGNGMMTIVKGTAMAEYVSREHVAALNGALGVPLALVRSASPLVMGLLWTAGSGYRNGLWLMLLTGVGGVLALGLAQRLALASRH